MDYNYYIGRFCRVVPPTYPLPYMQCSKVVFTYKYLKYYFQYFTCILYLYLNTLCGVGILKSILDYFKTNLFSILQTYSKYFQNTFLIVC